MKRIRLLKIIIRNFHRLHPRYLSLLKKREALRPLINANPIKKQCVFIITSCINVHDNAAYPIHNVNHSAINRFNEAIDGLESVRENHDQSYIIFLESSKIPIEYEEKIKALVDEFYDYSGDKLIDISRKHFNKGVPQFTAILKFFEENRNNLIADVFHFLGARYCLTGNITNNLSLSSGAFFLNYPEHNNVSTRYFFISNLTMFEIIKAFRKTLFCAIVGASVEDYIKEFFPENTPLNKLCVKGLVNGQHMIYE